MIKGIKGKLETIFSQTKGSINTKTNNTKLILHIMPLIENNIDHQQTLFTTYNEVLDVLWKASNSAVPNGEQMTNTFTTKQRCAPMTY